MQRIIVKNFGPLKDIDLEIKDFMVIIGPNASGKSTLTKLIYFFNSIPELIKKSIENDLDKEENPFSYTIHLAFWNYHNIGFGDFFKENTSIKFVFHSGEAIKLSYNNSPTIPFLLDFSLKIFDPTEITKTHSFYKTKWEKLQKNKNIGIDQIREQHKIREQHSREIERLLGLTFGVEMNAPNCYFPDGRSYFRSASSPKSENLVNNQFIVMLEEANYFLKDFGENPEINKLATEILKGRPSKVFGDSIGLELTNGEKAQFYSLSSGQKETFWLIVILDLYFKRQGLKNIFMEEPETHLFPESQKSIMKLLCYFFNNTESKLFINTHSHYVIGTINVLINAYRLGQIHPEEVNKVIPKAFWLNRENVFVGYLKDGEIRNIYDEEAEMYEIEELTHVASILNEEFDKLDQIEFADADTN